MVWTVINDNLNFQQFHLEEIKELRWRKFFIAMTRNKVFFSLSIEIFHDTTNGLKKAPDTTNRTSRGRYRNWFNKFSFGCMWLCKCKTSINLTPTTRRWNTLLKFHFIPPTNTHKRNCASTVFTFTYIYKLSERDGYMCAPITTPLLWVEIWQFISHIYDKDVFYVWMCGKLNKYMSQKIPSNCKLLEFFRADTNWYTCIVCHTKRIEITSDIDVFSCW